MQPSDLSILTLITEASPLVQAVIALLLVASIISWTFIFDRARVLRRAKRELISFEEEFWSGRDLVSLFRTLGHDDANRQGCAEIFYAGFREFTRLQDNPQVEPTARVEGAQRAMRVAVSRELDQLEQQLPFLATVGSSSPYIGLFGTVCGIMNAFQALSQVKQATLQLVAPGIAEALIATAMGLFAAIPAVIAYNKYRNTVHVLGNRYDDFVDEFTNILQRQAYLKT